MTQICNSGQPSRCCDRKTFEVMTNVHPPNRFAHKERIWYDYNVPIKKKKRHKRRHDMKFVKGNNHDFTQRSCQNLIFFRFSIKVLKTLSKNV